MSGPIVVAGRRITLTPSSLANATACHRRKGIRAQSERLIIVLDGAAAVTPAHVGVAAILEREGQSLRRYQPGLDDSCTSSNRQVGLILLAAPSPLLIQVLRLDGAGLSQACEYGERRHKEDVTHAPPDKRAPWTALRLEWKCQPRRECRVAWRVASACSMPKPTLHVADGRESCLSGHLRGP